MGFFDFLFGSGNDSESNENGAKYTEKTTITHDDGIKRTEHDFIVKRDNEGNTRTYHGYGGKSGSHTTEHKDGSVHRKE